MAKNTPIFFFACFACGETEPLPDKRRTVFFAYGEKRFGTQQTGCGKPHHVVKKTYFAGKMCTSATFHHLIYALLGSIQDFIFRVARFNISTTASVGPGVRPPSGVVFGYFPYRKRVFFRVLAYQVYTSLNYIMSSTSPRKDFDTVVRREPRCSSTQNGECQHTAVRITASTGSCTRIPNPERIMLWSTGSICSTEPRNTARTRSKSNIEPIRTDSTRYSQCRAPKRLK